MSDSVTQLPKLGQTFFGGRPDSATVYGQSVSLEGTPHDFNDTAAVAGPDGRRSGRRRRAVLVRNASTLTLEAKRIVKWQSGFRGRRVDGYCNVDSEAVAGVVDDTIGSNGVVPGDLFWLLREGPALCHPSLAANAENVISVDDMLIALTAVTSGATTAGRVVSWNALTSTAAQATDGTAARRTFNRIGRALSARTTAQTTSDVLVDLMIL